MHFKEYIIYCHFFLLKQYLEIYLSRLSGLNMLNYLFNNLHTLGTYVNSKFMYHICKYECSYTWSYGFSIFCENISTHNDVGVKENDIESMHSWRTTKEIKPKLINYVGRMCYHWIKVLKYNLGYCNFSPPPLWFLPRVRLNI